MQLRLNFLSLLSFSSVVVLTLPVRREVPQEHSHEKFLTTVRSSLDVNNPNEIVDPVFALLGNDAAAQGAGKVTDLDCLQLATADQAFTNAKQAGDVDGQVAALVYRALERNTGKVGLASAPCTSLQAVNPEIAAIQQHQDPASTNAASINKNIVLTLAQQIAAVGGDPLTALESGTFKPGNVSDPTGAGNTCDDQNDAEGCIFTQNLLVPDATEEEIETAVSGGAGAGNGNNTDIGTSNTGVGSGAGVANNTDIETDSGASTGNGTDAGNGVNAGTGAGMSNSSDTGNAGTGSIGGMGAGNSTGSGSDKSGASKGKGMAKGKGKGKGAKAGKGNAGAAHNGTHLGMAAGNGKAGHGGGMGMDMGNGSAGNGGGVGVGVGNGSAGNDGGMGMGADNGSAGNGGGMGADNGNAGNSGSINDTETGSGAAGSAASDAGGNGTNTDDDNSQDDNNNGDSTGSTGGAGSGQNLQTFTGALGGATAPAVTAGGKGFIVEGSDQFQNVGAALGRSCDIQHNKCADIANSAAGKSSGLSVGQCDQQDSECRAATQN